METVLYTRVSTAEQTLVHQLTQTKATGFQVDEVVGTPRQAGVPASGLPWAQARSQPAPSILLELISCVSVVGRCFKRLF